LVIVSDFEIRISNFLPKNRGFRSDTNSEVHQRSIVRTGDQGVTVEILNGPFQGRVVKGNNALLGQMDLDKILAPLGEGSAGHDPPVHRFRRPASG
jgi:hypothetical protein